MVCIPGLLWVWISLLVPVHGRLSPAKNVQLIGGYQELYSNSSVFAPTAIETSERLRVLRDHMQSHNLSAYIIPATDAHMSEYIAERDKRLAWMTGFTGSSGTGVVTLQKAALFTDSRYWIQAERQMDCNWELQKSAWISSIGQWMVKEVPAGGNIGLDPYLFSIDDWDSYLQALKGSDRTLVAIDDNLVDPVWGSQRPLPPTNAIYQLPDNFIGSTWQEKVSHTRTQMENHSRKPTAVLLSGLEETAWLFNLRGDDIPYTPVFYAYTLLTKTNISLFVNRSRLSGEASQALVAGCPGPLCVTVEDYEAMSEILRKYVQQDSVHVWIGTEYTTLALYREIPPEKRLEENYSPVMITKASKNSKEQELMRAAHVRDAVAVIRYLVWLEKTVPSGTVDEISGANFVDQLRREELFCQGPSFETISASGLNAALAHYSPSNTTSRKLTVNEMYLLDSGGQYLTVAKRLESPSFPLTLFVRPFGCDLSGMGGLTGGYFATVSIAHNFIRRWNHRHNPNCPVGEPTALQKEAYTRVLMGNIDLSRLVFPPKTSGRMVEVLARRPLWEVGLNYGHGTGHGIGNFLSVHEWPVGFQSSNVLLDKGMFTSIEPGYYLEGEFGIRLEDVVLVVEAQTKYLVHEEPYLTFEVVSLVPYARNLIDINLLSHEQIQYINSYYESIRKHIGPELQRRHLDEEYQWLQRNTQPLSRSSLLAASLGTLAMGTVTSTLLPGA